MLKFFTPLWKKPFLNDCFLITSAGCCATRWLAQCLTQHPEILCSAGAGETQDVLKFGQKYDAAQAERVAHFSITHFASATPTKKLLEETFDELRRFSRRRYYGNVHLYTVESLLAYLREENLQLKIPLANMIRHPISRLDTHYRYWTKNYSHGPNCKRLLELCLDGYRSKYLPLLARFGGELEFENNLEKRIFVYSLCDTLNAFWSDFKTNRANLEIPHFRMEDLKGNRDIFGRLMKIITKGQVTPTAEYFDQIFAPENLEAERFTGLPQKTPDMIWKGWAPWQRKMVQEAINLTGFDQIYEDLGYDFSFLISSRAITSEFICFHNPPKLIEENVRGFNLVGYAEEFWAIKQSLGPVDLGKVYLDENLLSNGILRADSIRELKGLIRSQP